MTSLICVARGVGQVFIRARLQQYGFKSIQINININMKYDT
jgi:hypothetical protein